MEFRPTSKPGNFGPASNGWSRESFASLDQHRSALKRVRPALGWTSRQIAPGSVEGSVVAWQAPRFTVTCTSATGAYEMRGPASTENLVLSLALAFPVAGLQWLQPVMAGMVGVYQPCVPIDALNRGAVSFVVIDIQRDELEREAEREGLAIPGARISASGVMPGRISGDALSRITGLVCRLHNGESARLPTGIYLGEMILAATVRHLAQGDIAEPAYLNGSYVRIVDRARAYIEAHLGNPIAIDELVRAAATSRRTLHRAFVEVLGVTPHAYILMLRLNRIRQDLASREEADRTVTTVSHRWGIAELGKLAARYRNLFGELPSETLARRNSAGFAGLQSGHRLQLKAQTA